MSEAGRWIRSNESDLQLDVGWGWGRTWICVRDGVGVGLGGGREVGVWNRIWSGVGAGVGAGVGPRFGVGSGAGAGVRAGEELNRSLRSPPSRPESFLLMRYNTRAANHRCGSLRPPPWLTAAALLPKDAVFINVGRGNLVRSGRFHIYHPSSSWPTPFHRCSLRAPPCSGALFPIAPTSGRIPLVDWIARSLHPHFSLSLDPFRLLVHVALYSS